jgi:hypothetical protein
MGRIFCVTEQGRFGRVLDSAEIGDVVVALRGRKIPFARKERRDGTWEVLGDVYLAGAMDGS